MKRENIDRSMKSRFKCVVVNRSFIFRTMENGRSKELLRVYRPRGARGGVQAWTAERRVRKGCSCGKTLITSKCAGCGRVWPDFDSNQTVHGTRGHVLTTSSQETRGTGVAYRSAQRRKEFASSSSGDNTLEAIATSSNPIGDSRAKYAAENCTTSCNVIVPKEWESMAEARPKQVARPKQMSVPTAEESLAAASPKKIAVTAPPPKSLRAVPQEFAKVPSSIRAFGKFMCQPPQGSIREQGIPPLQPKNSSISTEDKLFRYPYYKNVPVESIAPFPVNKAEHDIHNRNRRDTRSKQW